MQNSVKFLMTAALAFVTLAASAQISIGPRVGVNLAKWSADGGEDVGDFKNRTGYQFGVAAEIRLNDHLAFQPEINFIQKGTRQDMSVVDSLFGEVAFKSNAYINYLEVPVLVKAGTSFGPARIDVLAGPSFGYGLNGKAKTELTIGGETMKDESDLDFKEDGVKRFDLGLQFGAAVSFSLGERASLFVDGRYLLGLSDLNDDAEADTKINNRGIGLSAGVLLKL